MVLGFKDDVPPALMHGSPQRDFRHDPGLVGEQFREAEVDPFRWEEFFGQVYEKCPMA